MKTFLPGADYGRAYDILAMVCINPVERSFQQCDATESIKVLAGLQSAVSLAGLSRQVLVARSGCILGCEPNGTAVSLVAVKAGNTLLHSWRDATSADVPAMIDHMKAFLKTAPV